MGLDMYLGVRTEQGIEQVGYWRKANAIHGWFVRECGDNVDECQEIPVPKIKLLELQALCLVTLLKRKDEEVITSDESPKSSSAIPEDGDIGKFIAEQMKQQTVIALMEKEFENPADPLRPVAGFFFGGTAKDEYYYADIAETAQIIAEAVTRYPDGEFIYQASW